VGKLATFLIVLTYFLIKTLITAVIVAAISELASRYTLWSALLASLPLTSMLAFIWVYVDSKDTQKIIHPEGNPHIHLNPHNIAFVAAELVKRLEAVDSANAAVYRSRYADFAKRWDNAMKRWEAQGKNLRGAPVITHHKSLTYLIDWLGMVESGTLEAKPGIPPTTSHLETLLAQQRAHPARAILRTPYEPEDASAWLSEKTGEPAVVLPYTIGGDSQSSDLFALFDRTIALLAEASRGAH